MVRRKSVAAWVLMAVLTVAPSLALAAMACAPHCCPAAAESAESGAGGFDDCRTALASRTCCSESPAPLASFAPARAELPIHFHAIHAILPESPALASETLREPLRSACAELALRTSPLRLSVVLLI